MCVGVHVCLSVSANSPQPVTSEQGASDDQPKSLVSLNTHTLSLPPSLSPSLSPFPSLPPPLSPSLISHHFTLQADSLLCQSEMILRETLSHVITRAMHDAYGDLG